MIVTDPTTHVADHRQQLLDEADNDRLAAQLPPRPWVVRHELARFCVRLADWLDGVSDAGRPADPLARPR
jgi:hypothetical protein